MRAVIGGVRVPPVPMRETDERSLYSVLRCGEGWPGVPDVGRWRDPPTCRRIARSLSSLSMSDSEGRLVRGRLCFGTAGH